VRIGHVRRLGGVTSLVVTAQVRRHALVLEIHLDGRAGEANLDDLAGQLVGHGVVVTLDLDVVVDVDLRSSPRRELVRGVGQGSQCRPVDLFEQRSARALQLLKGLRVGALDQRSDRFIQVRQTREALFS